MRRVVCGFVSVMFFASQAYAATSHAICARPAEMAAFDIAGLKSQLMVTALSCSLQDRYNAFVIRYRPSLVAEDHALDTYFGRAYGRGWRSKHDDYVTLLANNESEQGTKLGTDFCRENVSLFDEVMALPGPSALPAYAAGKDFPQPITLVACPVEVRRARSVHHRHHVVSHKEARAAS